MYRLIVYPINANPNDIIIRAPYLFRLYAAAMFTKPLAFSPVWICPDNGLFFIHTRTAKTDPPHLKPPSRESCSARGNEKKVDCLQVLLRWCVLAAADFASVGKHREICSAVLPPSTMEDGGGWLTGFGAASGLHSQDLRPQQPVCFSARDVAFHTPTGPDEPLDLSAPNALFVYIHAHGQGLF